MATDHWTTRVAPAVVRESFWSNDCGILGDMDRHVDCHFLVWAKSLSSLRFDRLHDVDRYVSCHVQVVPESWILHYSDMFNDVDKHVTSHV